MLLETREKIGIVLGFVVAGLGFVGYYLWRDRPAVAAVRTVDATEDLTACSFVTELRVKIGPANRFDPGQSHNAQLLDAEHRIRREAVAVDANTIMVTADALNLKARAFRCESGVP